MSPSPASHTPSGLDGTINGVCFHTGSASCASRPERTAPQSLASWVATGPQERAGRTTSTYAFTNSRSRLQRSNLPRARCPSRWAPTARPPFPFPMLLETMWFYRALRSTQTSRSSTIRRVKPRTTSRALASPAEALAWRSTRPSPMGGDRDSAFGARGTAQT